MTYCNNAPITFQFEIRIGKGVHSDWLAEAAEHINNKVLANGSSSTSTSRHLDATQANKIVEEMAFNCVNYLISQLYF